MRVRQISRLGLVLGLALAIGATGNMAFPFGQTSAAAAQSGHKVLQQYSPVGTWSGRVVRGNTTDYIDVAFEPDGTLCLMTVDGSSPGKWVVGPNSALQWQALEQLPGGSGSVQVNQTGTFSFARLWTSGTTAIFDPAGAQVGSVFAEVQLARNPTITSTCS